MALRNARDLYTRRQEGVSIWVVPAAAITASQPGREGLVLRPGRRQGLPAPDVLRRPRRAWSTCERPRCLSTYAPRLGRRRARLRAAAGRVVAARPELEEDIALTNIALDLLGQARALLTYAGRASRAPAATEDDLAYLRDEREFRNCSWSSSRTATSPSRWRGCSCSRPTRSELYAALAALHRRDARRRSPRKAVKEVAYHRDHASAVDAAPRRRHRRVPRPDAGGAGRRVAATSTSCSTPLDRALAGSAVDPASLREAVARRPGARRRPRRPSTVPEVAPAHRRRPRGLHTEHLGYLLAEMQHLHRSHPGATW